MAFAIIATGGKQYRVEEGKTLSVEKLPGVKDGETTVFTDVLLMDDGTSTKVGTPYLEGVTIEAVVEGVEKGKKIHIQKFKSKSRYKRRVGHRQQTARVVVGKVK